MTDTLLELVVDEAGDGDPRHPQRLLADQAPDGGQAEVEQRRYPLLRRHFASCVKCRVASPNFLASAQATLYLPDTRAGSGSTYTALG